MPDALARQLLSGAVGYHTHVGWIRGSASSASEEPLRAILDPMVAVQSARDAGLRAIVLRDLYSNSAGMASVLQKLVPEIEVVGGLILNAEVGGINPYAVFTSLTYGKGARFVCLATDSSALMAQVLSGVPREEILADPVRYVTPYENGRLKSEMYEILEMVAEHDIILETGHYAAKDHLHLIAEARRVGVKKILVTHAITAPISGADWVMTEDDQKRAADSGAFIEFAWAPYTHHRSYRARRYATAYAAQTLLADDVGRAFDTIRAIGAERCVLSTDFGQLDEPQPVEGLRQFIFCLLDLGMSEGEIGAMVRDNPLSLLGLAPNDHGQSSKDELH